MKLAHFELFLLLFSSSFFFPSSIQPGRLIQLARKKDVKHQRDRPQPQPTTPHLYVLFLFLCSCSSAHLRTRRVCTHAATPAVGRRVWLGAEPATFQLTCMHDIHARIPTSMHTNYRRDISPCSPSTLQLTSAGSAGSASSAQAPLVTAHTNEDDIAITTSDSFFLRIWPRTLPCLTNMHQSSATASHMQACRL